MIIFVEGVDGSGKTTLVNELRFMGYTIAELIPRGKSNDGDYWTKLNEKYAESVVIMDRSFLSEIVYRTYDRRELEMPILNLMSIFFECDYAIIYCHSDTAFLDSMARGEDNIMEHSASIHIQFLYIRLLQLATKLDKKIYTYSWRTDNIEKIMQFIDTVKGGAK